MDARSMRRRTAAALLAAVTAATLAGCGGASSGPAGGAGAATTTTTTTTTTNRAAATATTATASAGAAAPSGATSGATTGATKAAPLRLAFTTTRRTVAPGRVAVEVPVVRATGGDATSRTAAEAAVTGEVDRLVAGFSAVLRENADLTGPRSGVLTATAGRWRGYLTVRIEQSAQTGGMYPANTVHGLLLDAATGRPVPVARLFTDTRAVDDLVRRRLVSDNRRVFADGVVTAADLRGVSVVAGADGRTTPLTCLPAEKGLACTVDQDSVAPHVVGPLDAVVPWSGLDGLLTA